MGQRGLGKRPDGNPHDFIYVSTLPYIACVPQTLSCEQVHDAGWQAAQYSSTSAPDHWAHSNARMLGSVTEPSAQVVRTVLACWQRDRRTSRALQNTSTHEIERLVQILLYSIGNLAS